MANNSIINVVDIGNPSTTRRAVDLLPEYLRTDKNTKFLTSTIDQLVQPPIIERISGFIGSTLSPNYNPATDTYIPAANQLEGDYQLEPALIVRDNAQSIKKVVGYDDILNQIAFENGNIENHNRLFKGVTYAYDPQVDLDKFLNYTEYYWLPTGPATIEITGIQQATVSTYTITDDPTRQIFVFTPDGITPDPLITLYRGMTYVFNVDSIHNVWFKTAISSGSQDAYTATVSNNGAGTAGQIVFVVDDNTPDIIYYVAGDDDTIVGQFVVKNLEQNTALDVEADILGKTTYTSGNGIQFSNGMKIRFNGNITPASYNDKEWVVEGVGIAITLTDWASLSVGSQTPVDLDVNFDATNFDQYPFDNFTNIPLTPEYVTINRASLDVNPWSRGNRWCHANVITAAAKANNTTVVFPYENRAQRPIVEFYPNIKLYNYGSTFTAPVDVIDNLTLSAFKNVEGQAGYYVDGELLQDGYRVIFNADTDNLVKGRIYTVSFVNINGNNVISLTPATDNVPTTDSSVSVLRGTENAGKNWWFNGTEWIFSQQKTALNQAPLFDVFDENGISYSDATYYRSTFQGTKLFGYRIGTGTPDSVLGFPLEYLNVNNIGDYLFNNYFNTDTFTVIENNNIITIWVKNNFLKVGKTTNFTAGLSAPGTINSEGAVSVSQSTYINTWVQNPFYQIPIVQFQVCTTASNYVEVTAVNNPGYLTDIQIQVYVNDSLFNPSEDYYLVSQGSQYFVYFTTNNNINDRILLRIFTAQPPNGNGFYDIANAGTNNPLNGPIGSFTLAEVVHSLKDIASPPGASLNLQGSFPGNSNLRDIGPIAQYGTRLVNHGTPLSFAQFFIGNKEHSLLDAVKKVADHYSQFKLAFVKRVTELQGTYTPAEAVDVVMTAMTTGKNSSFAYGYSDMIAFGQDAIVRNYTVTDPRVKNYSLTSEFNNDVLGVRAILVYHNNTQLVYGQDYTFSEVEPVVTLSITLKLNDVITVKDYGNTAGCYIPPTPTKLGLYPAYIPSIYLDDTYVTPTTVIQGHDGSIITAYGDFRDAVILELETRIYNNLKVQYNRELLDMNEIIPGAFRSNDYGPFDTNNIIISDFLKWAGFFGIDYQTNDSFNALNPKTWNYSNGAATDVVTGLPLPGNWRAIFKWYYDTDRPHTCPWEMLGFTVKPSWWDAQYGSYPYTSGNLLLWEDLRDGRIRQGDRAGVDPLYVRPNLLDIIPVDSNGNLLTVDITNIIGSIDTALIAQPWNFGDQGPAETAWRRSSLWPYAVQILLALTRPVIYSAYMFDPSRMIKNIADQYRYTTETILANTQATQLVKEDTQKFLDISNLLLWNQLDINGNRILSSGYNVLLVEANNQRTYGYATQLQEDLSNIDYNLFGKMGGFISKDKIRIIIDAVDPTSANPGVLLPQEDYDIYFNVSNPSNTYSASGIIVQKGVDGYTIRGYDKNRPYYRIYRPVRTSTDPTINVGGVSESYVVWTAGQFYQKGQYVGYSGAYYIVTLSHTAGNTFGGSQYFQQLPKLPTLGGVSVLGAVRFESTVTIVPYGTTFPTIQAVFDVIVGYGEWLKSQGFVFDEVQPDLNVVMDWTFSGREFLYWTSQNWEPNSIITVSPFADRIKFNMTSGVVDNLDDPYYEYSLYKADGNPFPQHNYTISRQDSVFTVQTINTQEGIFFAQFSTVQKEHAIIINNTSLFGDIIYQIETGYRQLRVNVSGFRTAKWTGDFFSPGFVYDNAEIQNWAQYTDYQAGDVVRYNGKYYGTNVLIPGSITFNFNQWSLLPKKPVPTLYPNFDYKINQFEDFYSLDIDNFDAGQEKMAQHLTGYTPRIYLDNIFNDPIAQYKFYQGYIREKGTKSAIDKLAKASLHNLQGRVTFNEAWAFRVGTYGGIITKNEYEVALSDSAFLENPQLIEFVDSIPVVANDLTYYKTPYDLLVKPEGFINFADQSWVFTTTSATYNSSSIKMPVAGYVHYDDITATVYNKNSILDIANPNQLKDGDILWMGFKEDGDWDVLRYTLLSAKAISAQLVIGAPNQFAFSTDQQHGLSAGDVVSVTRFNTGMDAVYIVVGTPDPYTFLVNTSLSGIPTNTETTVGLLFRFVSSRINTFSDIQYNPVLETSGFGTKVWVDNNDGNWAVIERVDNFQSSVLSSGITKQSAKYGSVVYSSADDSVLIVSAPGYSNPALGNAANNDIGRVFFYNTQLTRNAKNVITTVLLPVTNWELNDSNAAFSDSGIPANFGSSIAYESNDRIIIAGAPNASNVKLQVINGVAHSIGSLVGNGFNNCGLVKISNINTQTNLQNTLAVIGSTNGAPANALFGQSLAIQNIPGQKILLVGAPGEGAGQVYEYGLTVTNALISTQTSISMTATTPVQLSHNYSGSAKFGYSIASTSTMDYVAIGVPGVGEVAIYSLSDIYSDTPVGNQPTMTQVQRITTATINSALGANLQGTYGFGNKVVMSPDGNFLFASLTGLPTGISKGAVVVSTFTNGQYVPSQIIETPNQINGITFGFDIASSPDSKTLVVTAFGSAYDPNTTFNKDNPITWDSGATHFVSVTTSSGSVYVYTEYNNYFAFGQQLSSSSAVAGSGFGNNATITSNEIIIGAPTTVLAGAATGQIVLFTGKDGTTNSWKVIRSEDDLVDLDKITRIVTLDDFNQEIVDYIEFIDPIKGRIPGQADQELKFKSLFDPAVYSLGNSAVVVDTNTNWIDEHVGQLWWDLSSVKYMWYEQDTYDYRRNNWGGVFPGSTFDVYEWVGTQYLPSQWAALADTADGLAQGISGQPKYSDNSVMSVKQVYNSVSASFTNVYYFWVKNKTVLPANTTRRMSAFDVASLISNPQAQGLQYAMLLGPTALAMVNYKTSLVSDNIHLSIEMDTIDNAAQIHTEWLLVEEGNPESMPNSMLEQKLIDSILGHDSLGNLVPDPTLPSRLQTGINIRPRQSMFVDRKQAMKNIFEYANSILSTKLINGSRSFSNLNAMEEIPAANTGVYDIVVPDLATLNFIVTKFFAQAEVSISVNDNGGIDTITILNPGNGYINAPYIEITGDGTGAVVTTVLNSQGQIVGANIISAGKGYTVAYGNIRPYAGVVQTDSSSNGNWAIYQWVHSKHVWVKSQTQSYNTTYYWNYIDWKDPSYNELQPAVSTVDSTYELDILSTVAEGNYVKVRNGGDGRYLILRRTASGNLVGTFDANWDLMVSENGTIQFSSLLWNTINSVYAFDEISSFDQTAFDQTPDQELNYILLALKDDIFVGDLRVYWNTLYFKAVKYALSEQKNLDWTFKTTFIGVTNHAGSLDQRPTYKLQDSNYYESYINEVKPYHTKIRNFTVNYTATDYSSTLVTDFDLPSYWDANQKRFRTVGFGNGELLSAPWNNWFTNYTYGIQEIIVTSGGKGYQFAPTVQIISAPGDLGTGATADAYISNGTVYKIIVTNPGTGYATTPTIVMAGGGGPTVVIATAYPILGNSAVRSITTTLKFDRVGYNREVGSKDFTDNYLADGETFRYPMTWIPTMDKAKIELKINGVLQLSDSYTITISTGSFVTNTGTSYIMTGPTGFETKYNQSDIEYSKEFATLELSAVPTIKSTIEITYPKDIEYFTAVDRIQDYYAPTSGMPGADQLGQLMTGIDFPGVKVDTLPYSFSGGYGVLPYWSSAWDNYSTPDYYGVVLNPQVSNSNDFNLISSELFSATAEQTSLNSQITYVQNTLGTVAQYTTVSTALGNQSVLNPYYTSLVAQIESLQSQVAVVSATVATLSLQLAELNNGSVGVTTPFSIATGTQINTYLNGVRIDGASSFNNVGVDETEHSLGNGATFDVGITNTIPSNYIVTTITTGTGYVVNDILRIFGTSLGGQRSYYTLNSDGVTYTHYDQNDLIITVTSTSTAGSIKGISVQGVPNITRTLSGNGTSETVYIPKSELVPYVTVTNIVTTTGVGPYLVTFSISTQTSIPSLGTWIIAGNENVAIDGTYQATTASTTTITLSYNINPGSFGLGITTISTANNIVTFRNSKDDGTQIPTDDESLDTIISGGDYSGTILGINPADIVIDGDAYITANASHAPEEMIPGEIQESVAISVFSVNTLTSATGFLSAPLISNYKYQLDGQTQSFYMGNIANTSSLIVVAGNTPLHYGTDYLLDVTNNNIALLATLPGPDYLSISSFDIGGINVIDKQVQFSAATITNVLSNVAMNDIGSVYVTVNGIPVPEFSSTSTQTYGWTMQPAPSGENRGNPRAYLTIIKPRVIEGINNAAINKVQVWYFDAPYKAAGEVYTQVIPRAQGTVFALEQPPGIAGPYSSQVIVELNNRRLIPPATIYFIVGSNLTSFQLSGSGTITTFDSTSTNVPANPGTHIQWTILDATGVRLTQDINYPRGYIDNSKLEVWLNGSKLDNTPSNYFLNAAEGIVQFPSGRLNTGDALAFVIFDSYEYQITDNQLLLQTLRYRGANDTIRITSFTNHDGDFLRKEKFNGNSLGVYKIQRPVFDSAYIWVEYNGASLIADIDYTIGTDGTTITIRPSFYTGPSDTIVIMSMSQDAYVGSLSYRMFTDILGRTSVKRIGDGATTTLTNPLLITDTSILVEDGSVLSHPNPQKGLPGIIYVAGERIEYFAKYGNVLSQITRATLGTGARSAYSAGTKVIDQGVGANVPVLDQTITQTYIPAFTDVTSIISDGSYITYYYSATPSQTFVAGDQITVSGIQPNAFNGIYTVTSTGTNFVVVNGTATSNVTTVTNGAICLNDIALTIDNLSFEQNIKFTALANPWDQVDVFYGGKKLLKPTTNTVVTYNPVAYDSNQTDSNGNTSNMTVSPEFTITNSLTSPVVQLNIEVTPGQTVVVRQRVGQSMFKLSSYADPAQASETVLRPGQEFTDTVKGFLLQDTSQLPDDTYYGGDPVIILETEFILQDEDGTPIEGE